MTTLIINNNSKKNKLIRLEKAYNNNKIIIMYVYADWCIYCQIFKQSWVSFKKEINKNPKLKEKILLVELNSNYLKFRKENEVLDKLLKNFKLYPTIIYSHNSKISYLVGDNKLKDTDNLIKKSTKSEKKIIRRNSKKAS
tara:strand:+ start:844 stop:1263 length:420 start_codon:yes stop_codon:yes gene_type:complete